MEDQEKKQIQADSCVVRPITDFGEPDELLGIEIEEPDGSTVALTKE